MKNDPGTKGLVSVNFATLLNKLEKLNTSTPAFHWFNSYLSEHCQSVNIKCDIFKALTLEDGLMQGSILGPLSLIIYTSDLPLLSPKTVICVKSG